MKKFTYHNPCNPFQTVGQFPAPTEELRDPCITRDGDWYYLIFTVFPFTHHTSSNPEKPDYNSSPGIKMYKSKDLQNWEFVTWVVKSSELPEDCPYKHRFWAPELRKINGRYWVTFTANNWIKEEYNPHGEFGMYAFTCVADNIEGPYQHFVAIDGAGCDTSLFGDDDGRVYAFIPGMHVYVQELDVSNIDNDEVKLIGEKKLIVTATNDDIGLDWNYKYLEGPWCFKENGRYYLFYAGLRKDGWTETGFDAHGSFEYWSGVAYADNPMGPYTKDPEGKAFYGGHLVTFNGPDGRHWFAYRNENDNSIRGKLCIDPMDIAPDKRLVTYDPTIGEKTVEYDEDKAIVRDNY